MKTDRYGTAKRSLSLTPAQWVALRLAVEDRCAVVRKAAINARTAHVHDESDPIAKQNWDDACTLDTRIHNVLTEVREAIDRPQK